MMILEGLQEEDNRFSMAFDNIMNEAEELETAEEELSEAIQDKERFLEDLESKKQDIDRRYLDLKKGLDASTANILEKL